MAQGKSVSLATLEQWQQNFLNNKNLGFTTNSVAISFSALEEYLAELKNIYTPAQLKGLGIFFIRYPFSDASANLPHIEKAGNNVSQTSIALAPLKTLNTQTGALEKFSIPNQDNIHVLAMGDPQGDPAASIVLCPPKCG